MTSLLKGARTVITTVFVIAGLGAGAGAQGEKPARDQLPSDLKGAKVYHLSENNPAGVPLENLVASRRIEYKDINFDRLLLNLYLSLQPVDRDASVRKIYFQDVRVGGFPVHLKTLEQEFKISKTQAVDLPTPVECSVIYSDLESVAALRPLVEQDKIRITGESFIEVKLNTAQKIFLRSKKLVIPVKFSEEIPLDLFSNSILAKMAAMKILDVLSDPTASAAAAIARERLAKITREHSLLSFANRSLYLVYCEYALRNPKTGTTEKFSQAGTGFLVSADGKLLTAKRVIQPWKFDPQIAFLISRYDLEVDDKNYKLAAWPAGSQVLGPDGRPDLENALSTAKQSLQVVKTGPDQFEKVPYQDPDSGESATLSLAAEGASDVAILQLHGGDFVPLAFAEPAGAPAAEAPATLAAFPYGLSQALAEPQLVPVKALREGMAISLDQALEPGESGAPLLDAEGKVLGLATSSKTCIPAESLRGLIP